MDVKYIAFGNSVEKLTKHSDGLWRDSLGTIWAYSEDSYSSDPVSRCGIGFFSLPEACEANLACNAHDFAYSSPTYQAYHTRKEADEDLKRSLIALNYPVIGPIFYSIARFLGGLFWENKKTNL